MHVPQGKVLHKGSISSTFYKQLLQGQISKVQKRQSRSQSFFLAHLGSAHAKAAHRMLVDFTNILKAAFVC